MTAIGADETAVRVNGEKTVIGVVTDAATGEVLGLDVLVNLDSDGFMEWLGDFARGCGVQAMAADDLNAYKPAVERLGLDHQICIAIVKKRARERLDRIEGWDWGKARIWRLPPDGGLELLRLERAVRDSDATLRRLCVELSGKWRAAVMPPQTAGRSADEQRGGAGDRRKRDKVQDSQWVEERRQYAERVGADATGLERSGRLGYVGAGRSAAPPTSAGESSSSETRPKMPNRFWDGYPFHRRRPPRPSH